MQIYRIDQYPGDALDKLINSIAFFRQIRTIDAGQFEMLMRYANILDLRPGEVVIEEGEDDAWLYFLIRGKLAVYAGNQYNAMRRIADILPGEVFGDLSLLLGHRRTASVIADTCFRHSLVFTLNFEVFGSLQDFSVVTLATKLTYYRIMVQNLRWKLEMYRSRYPDYAFASSHHKVRLFGGTPDSVEELISLHGQAQQFARLLINWNVELTRDDEPGEPRDGH